MIQSPLNYIGGKYKLLPQILPLFPKRINTFVDLFCGGCNVGINTSASSYIYNDINKQLFSFFCTLKTMDETIILKNIFEIINNYGLSLVSENGYNYYRCESGKGLAEYNKEHYLKLRKDFNQKIVEGKEDHYHDLMFYVLIIYAFNNQIRFNSKNEFNLPVGKRDFNRRMQDKLITFIRTLKSQQCTFSCFDFREFDISFLTSADFVYIDPPYLITCATYNEQGGWKEQDEEELLVFLQGLDKKRIRFALSNVLRSKGKENKILLDWLNKNQERFKVSSLDYNYANSNYQTKNKSLFAEEILITNY